MIVRKPVLAAALCLASALPPAWAEPAAPVANQLSLSASATADVTNDVLSIVFSTQREGADPAVVRDLLAEPLPGPLAARLAALPAGRAG